MQIKDIFEKNINRNINGVVKVNDDKETVLKQELEEYVVTKELKPHFHKFFNNFSESFEETTNKMGVWISGFFGSGKSHFLKILSYLLENKVVDNKKTIEYFRDKFDDPMEFDMIESCCSKGKNKTILFNIDSLSGDKTKTAIKEVFAQVFYDSLGYYGRNIKVVRFEKNLDKLGKLSQFKDEFYKVAGTTWEESRDAFDLFADLIISSLEKLGISKQSAENLVYAKDTEVFNIDSLVDDIKSYVNSQGKDFRLIFMVDEIGQYIGEDMNLMLNLQTLVEDLGTKCDGKVWVIVTSQEAIDKVIKVKGDQFSKIMGRFDTRIHLTSSSVEEVVKKRLLAKNKVGEDCLKVVYESKSASLKNTFTFEQAAADLKGYSSEEAFVEVYPFVPYQFRLFQNVLNELRTHDQAGFDTSDNSRNMLGAFRLGIIESKGNSATAFEYLSVGNNNNGALFSFDRFFDTISEKLNSTTRELIDRAITASENHDGIEKYDVCILKLLYLIRYVDKDIKATINNVSILMTDSIDQDQIALRKKVAESLERLKMHNYVSKNGDVFTFLSNEEKEVEIEIQNTHIDQEEISKAIGDIIFGDVYSSKKAKYGIYDFEFGRYVDDMPIGPVASDALRFMIVTPGNPLSDKDNEPTLIFDSMQSGKAICVLPNENGFYDKLRDVAKVEKYNKTKNQTSLAQAVKSAIAARVSQAKLDRAQINSSIEQALKNASFYISGQKVVIKGASAKEKISNSLTELITDVYKELDKITDNFSDPSEVMALFNQEESLTGRMVSNPDAVSSLEQYLNLRYQTMSTVTVAEIYKRYQNKPYGFRGYDIAAMIVELMIDQKVVLSYNGKEYKKKDNQISTLLFNKSYVDSVIVKQRIAIDPVLLVKCINIMKDFTNSMDVPTKEDAFIEFAINTLQSNANDCELFINNYYSNGNYPQKDAVSHAKSVYNEILLYKADASKFLGKIKEKENDLMDAQADVADIVAFFKGTQKGIYDNASKKVQFFNDDISFINENPKAKETMDNIVAILGMERPFSKIALLPAYVQTLEQIHSELLEAKKNVALKKIDDIKNELFTYVKDYNKDIYNQYVGRLQTEASFIENNAIKIVAVSAEESKIDSIKNNAVADLLAAKPADDNPNVEQPKELVEKQMSELFESTTLKTKGEVDQYVEKLKSKLYKFVSDGGVKIK